MANRDKVAVDSGLNDLLGNIIQSDRKRSGREISVPQPTQRDYDTMTCHSVIEQSEEPHQTEPVEDVKVVAPSPSAPGGTRRKATARRPGESLAEERVLKAGEMAESKTITVTLRIPTELNDWLDEYVHLSYLQKVRKQALVVEALKMLYVRRGKAGETVLNTSFLGEDEK